MKKLILFLCLLMALSASAQTRAIAAYDPVAAKTAAQNDILNWMSYLPDDVFVAHVSIPGTHDTATADGWKSTTGPSNSTTQEKNLDEQLAGGIRAFDFRPGMVNDELWCNHGTDQTNLKLADAFSKLKNFLDAHPKEFFVMHLFRGNIFRSGEASTGNKLLGAKDDESSRNKYNELFNQLFNQGTFADYFVDYSPYLKVKDVRGKIIVFRRDRIDFAHVAKAGNLTGWVGSEEEWSENSLVSVTNASDPTIKGIIRATDVSSPDSEDQLNIEKRSITNLFSYNCNQPNPNDAKKTGTYKPYWSMTFTSGAYTVNQSGINKENTKAYLENATHINPLFTNLVKNAEKKGPTGIVFSDWVLTDSHDGYATMGVELVPIIIYNNFDYIDQYILDDELFAEEAENIWEDGKEYFIRNVATGEFLSAGADWGTHAVLNKYGIRVKFAYDKDNNAYQLKTSFNNGGIGDNYFIDNSNPALFKAHREGSGHFSFSLGDKYMTALTNGNTYADGTVHVVDGSDYDKENTMQQWEVISVEDYFNHEIKNASLNNGVDISYMIRGHRFLPNDTDNWTGITNYKEVWAGINKTKIHASYIQYNGTNTLNDKNLVLHCHNTESNSTYNSNTVWSFTHTDNINKAGVYKLKFKAAHFYFNLSESTLTFKVNGQDLKSKLQSISANDASLAVTSFRDNPTNYTIELDLILDEKGEITFEASKTKTNSITGFFLDDIELIYYGPDPTATCEFLQKVVDDATAKVNALPENLREGWENEMAPYNAIIGSKDIVGDGSSEAYEIYNLLRKRVLQNITEGADFTGAIINNSFELGNGFGWDYSQSDQVDVKPNSDATYTVNNCDGNYLYNTWPKGSPITQTITNLPAGHYKLQAMAVTGDTSDDRYVYLLGGNSNSEALKINNNKVNFSEVEYEFDIPETGDAIIGILGGNEDGTYDEFGGYWYKADNFRLIYMGEPQMDSFYDFLRKAIDMATTRINKLPEEYRTGWQEEIAPYEAIIENRTLEGDATKEANEIYALMRAHVYSQNFAGADFTPAITNNSFEWGNTYGWTVTNPSNDTGVKNNSNPIYQVDKCDGEYLFNTWDGDDFGSPINQILPNLPAGKYRLEAMVASDQNNRIWITANNFKNYIQVSTPKTTMHNVELEFTINETQDVTIGAVGGTNTGTYWKADGGNWYKVDNFRLTYVSPLEQTITWTMEGTKYDTIILPFGVDNEDMPENLYFFSTDSFDDNNGIENYHVLSLGNAESSLLPYTPYIVMRANNVYSTRSVVAVDENTYEFTGIPERNNEIEYTSGVLTGVLSDTNVEEGHYIVSHGDENSFFTNAGGTVKAYHAYIRNDNTSATPISPSIYFEAPENIGTGVENIAADNRLVDVFTTTGIKIRRNVTVAKALDGLDPGIYILSDGSRIRKTTSK